MIINCLSCCKAISSLGKVCPYCRVEVVAPLYLAVEEETASIHVQAEIKTGGVKERLTGAMDKTLTTITHLLHRKRTTH